MSDELSRKLHAWRVNYALDMEPHDLAVFWGDRAPSGCALALKSACSQIEADTRMLRQALRILDFYGTVYGVTPTDLKTVTAIRARLNGQAEET